MRHVSFLLSVVCALVSNPALAQWRKITFNGEITTQTCEAKINGVDNPLIELPKVRDSTLADTNSVAGLKTFTLGISGCTHAEDGVQKVRVFFHVPGSQNAIDGNLTNTIPKYRDGAEGVALQLTKDAEGTQPIPLPANANRTAVSLDLEMELKDGTATHTFGVQYARTGSSVYPGKFSASANWFIAYL